MRILCIGNIEGWMEIHLRQMLAGFERRGCVTAVADYNRMGRRFGFLKSSEAGEFELRQRRLEKICAAFQPDLILFAISRMKFDLGSSPMSVAMFLFSTLAFESYLLPVAAFCASQ